jgi:hypothetical protein
MLLPIFLSPHKTKYKKNQKNIFERKPKKIIAVRRRFWSAQKMAKIG